MKTKEIAKQYDLPQWTFEKFLKEKGVGRNTVTGYVLEENVDQYVTEFKSILADKAAAEEAEKLAAEEAKQAKQKAMASMLISSGFTFDGYKITKYSGYISGDDVAEIPRETFGDTGMAQNHKLTDALVKIRRQALIELKEAAYNLGCNAVVGVDFDYLTFEPERSSALNASVTVRLPYIVCVTANGNAVVIEKEE